jgi:hypothetical protein
LLARLRSRRPSHRTVVAYLALFVALGTTAIAPASAGAASVEVNVSKVDCGWDPVTRTLWPAVRVVRTAGAIDRRVSARITLDVLFDTPRSLGMGRVKPDGALNQSGFVDGPPASIGVPSLVFGIPEWIRPWGGRFGDGVNGGAALTPGVNHTLHVSLFDFDTSTTVTRDISCRTAGPFVMQSYTHSTTAFAAGKVRRSLADVATVAGASGKLTCQFSLSNSVCSYATACAPAGATGPITRSFCWNNTGTGDANDWTSVWWRPQGLAGSFESGPGGDGAWSGVPAGKDVLLVSWYKHNSSDKTVGNRLSVMNTSVSPPRYVHVNLVEPCPPPSTCNSTGFRPLTTSHLGGLAWAGRYLYAAETNVGFRVFDLAQFYQLPGGAYVLPQVRTFSQVDTCPLPVAGKPSTAPCPLRFSFASTANGAPYRLVSGEFDETADSARIVSWPLGVNGLINTTAAARNNQKDELITGKDLVKLQGVAASGAKTVLSASFGSSNPGKRHRVATVSPWTNGGKLPGMGALTVGMPVGIEDLASTQSRNQLWAISEFERKRWIWETTFNSAFR